MSVDLQQVLTQIVGFLLLLWLMRKFAWGPLRGALDGRRRQIADEWANIARGKEEVERARSDYQAKIAEIGNQAKARLQEGVAEGERQAKAILDATRVEAQGILEKAKRDIQREADQARVMLRDEVAHLAVACAAKILRQEIDPERHAALIAQTLDQNGSGH